MASCQSYEKVDGNTEIPISVSDTVLATPADTLYQVKTEDHHYFFKKEGERFVLKEKYNTDNEYHFYVHGIWLLVFVFVGFVVGVWIRL